jgi:hypothetical protein
MRFKLGLGGIAFMKSDTDILFRGCEEDARPIAHNAPQD